MAKLAKWRAKLFKEEASTNVQIQPIPLERLEEEMTLWATSYTQTKIEIYQPLQNEEMSIQELMAKHMNEEKNMAKMSFEGQHESLPFLFEVIEEEYLSYNEDIISRSKEELKKITREDDNAQDSKTLVVMEDEPTSPESHKMIKYEVLKTILKMTPWGDMHE